MSRIRSARAAAGVLFAAAAVVTGCQALDLGSAPGAPAGRAQLPVVPDTVTVVPGVPEQQLADLTVAARGAMDGYSRDNFPHWDTVEGSCNTREEVLKRDGRNVQVDADCSARSGTWPSPYDGATWTQASDVDIDHVVPLANAWVSGARSWPPTEREQFANDLVRPQLQAVTDNVNQTKSDRAPDEWKPPLITYWCQYATDWIAVKHHYQLTITAAEKSALVAMLDHC